MKLVLIVILVVGSEVMVAVTEGKLEVSGTLRDPAMSLNPIAAHKGVPMMT